MESKNQTGLTTMITVLEKEDINVVLVFEDNKYISNGCYRSDTTTRFYWRCNQYRHHCESRFEMTRKI